ncbi:MAG: CRISPR-associated protein Cas4 [Cytophagales bacterium]|nr:CRISPR-associated protein Cas4 [Cytophagales bacterium]
MNLIATHINYLHICHRKLWLFMNGINMEHSSDLVYEGKHIGEHSYGQRSKKLKEVELDGGKIDFFDPKEKVIHETKKSNAFEKAHIAQVKYYLYLLDKNGVEGATGIIEYPKQKKVLKLPALTKQDFEEIQKWIENVEQIDSSKKMPPKKDKPSKCKNCSYFDFCWIAENEDQ